tara:strand:- start:1062 stop:2711 length:1650 start_codon:yes stop_codon:yes gene_type:complete
MEAAVLLGILGIGYLLKNDTNDNNDQGQLVLPLETDAYKSDYFEENDKEYKAKIFENYEKSKIPGSKILNYQNINKYINKAIEEPDDSSDKYIYSNISDRKIRKDDFSDNDQGIKMEPFFKRAPPNINFDDNIQLRKHQGGVEHKKKKKEQLNLFKPVKQLNVHGEQFDGDQIQSRYVASNINNNISPFEKQMVSPMDSKSSVIGDVNREYYEKSKTENIRTLSNQKESYEGRILPGSKHGKSGKIGQVFEHKPMNDYFNSADKWLTTTGAFTGNTERPEQIIPNTNRQFFNKQEFGPATGIDHESQSNRPLFALSNKQNFASDSVRNAGTSIGQMNNDTVKDSMMIYPNERDVTTLRTYDSNIKSEFGKTTMGIQDEIKNTIKQTTIVSANNGYLTGTDLPTERQYDDVKNTKKQFTTYDDNYVGVGGTNVSQPVNEDNYNNMETNATKEIIAQGRYPSPEGDKYNNSKETYNIEIKKNEQDYFNHRQTHYDRGNTEYLAKNTCNFTQFKNKLNDTSIGSMDGGRLDPNLLTPFKDNPYTQSLASFVY